MPKARVYELAKELGVDSKTVLAKLKDMGEFVKSASSTVEAPVIKKLRAQFPSAENQSGATAPASDAKGKESKQTAGKTGEKKTSDKKPAERKTAEKQNSDKKSADKSDKKAVSSRSSDAKKNESGKGSKQSSKVSSKAAPSPRQAVARAAQSPVNPAVNSAAQAGSAKASAKGNESGQNKPGQDKAGQDKKRNSRRPARPAAPNGRKPAAAGETPSRGRSASGPRPGNNPFSRTQGMHVPTPGDIPRPHPMNRGSNGPSGRNGNGGPSNRNSNGSGRGRGGRPSRSERPNNNSRGTSQWSDRRRSPGASGGGSRFGSNSLPSAGGPPSGGPRGRGRGGAAGAFGQQHGKSSKSRKAARRAKRQEYEEMKAPVIGGVRIPSGNGATIRLRQGATLSDLAEKIKVNAASLVTVLFHLGEMATATQSLDSDTFEALGAEIGWNIEIVSAEEEDKELLQQFDIDLDAENADDSKLVPRPPVVTVMGHVDHGKTRLLDTIRKTNVVSGEAGGITQRIGAYRVSIELNGENRTISFLDTPGHEAFTAMRARGAELTDLAILVVAADDGVMPQTVEAINHAQAANIPIVVAVNKIDVQGANPDKVRGQLTEFGLVPEEYGGDTMFVDISAKQGTNVDKLLEALLLTADATLDLRANPDMNARGATIEARLDKGRGSVASVLVQQGTLHIGDSIVAGTSYGRVRAMLDEHGENLEQAGPSTPVQVLGLTSVPSAGDLFLVAANDRDARQIAEKRQATERAAQLAKRRKIVSLEDIKEQFAKSEIDHLNIVIKGDSSGSVEALEESLMKIEVSDEVGIQVIHRGVGAITQNDVNLATVDKAVILGFNVRPNRQVADLAEREGVEIKYYSVIYSAIEDIEAALKGMLKPEYEEVVTSHSEIREIFRSSKFGNIAGVKVEDGTVRRGTKARIMRNGVVTFNDLEISTLRRFKDDVNEVTEGYEAGINLGSFNDIQIGDVIETFEMQEIERK